MESLPVFSHFTAASAKLDHRSRASMIAYLTAHDTHREDSDAPVFVHNVKLPYWGLNVPEPYLSAALNAVGSDNPFLYEMLEDTVFSIFHDEHPDAEIWLEGRSGGWLTLHISPDPFAYIGVVNGADTYSAEDWSITELRAIVRLVEAFDAACDDAVAVFMACCLENQDSPTRWLLRLNRRGVKAP